MKFAVVFAAAMVAVASAAGDCDIAKLAVVAGGANALACGTASGYKLVPPTAPTAAVVAKMCASSACTALLGELMAAAPTECTISLGTPIDLYAGLLSPIKKACDAASPATTPAPAGSAKPTESPVTPAPAC